MNTSAGTYDIFLIKYNSSGTKQWTKLWGNTSGDYGYGVTADSSDNIYVTGKASGKLDGNSNEGSGDMFLTKFYDNGTKQWTTLLGTSSVDVGYGVTTDSSNNIFVTGSTNGSLDGNSSSGDCDNFLTKYLDNGTKQWTKQWGSGSCDIGKGVVTDSSNNIYVAGHTNGSLDGSNSGEYDLFLTKFLDNGTKQWTKQLGTSTSEIVNGVTLDSTNNIYVTGTTNGSLDGNVTSGSRDIFLVKYNSSGTKQWTKQLGGEASAGNSIAWDEGNGVAVDSFDNIFVTGTTTGDLDGATNHAGTELFIIKYNSSGVLQ